MSTIIQPRREIKIFQIWNSFCQFITSTENRLYNCRANGGN
jgi:photosystem II P680 reaction center D1 protein